VTGGPFNPAHRPARGRGPPKGRDDHLGTPHARAYIAEAKWGEVFAPVSRAGRSPRALVTVTVGLCPRRSRGAARGQSAAAGAVLPGRFIKTPPTRDFQAPPPQGSPTRFDLGLTESSACRSPNWRTHRDPCGWRWVRCAQDPGREDRRPGRRSGAKRSVFLTTPSAYAVEQRATLGSNPGRPASQWTTPAVAASVDRRVVVSPRPGPQACWPRRPGAERPGVSNLEAFFRLACTYAAPAPVGRAVMLPRKPTLHLPEGKDGARIDLSRLLPPRAGRGPGPTTANREGRNAGLKHPAPAHEDPPPSPIHRPTWCGCCAPTTSSGTARPPDGRIFQTARGGILQDSGLQNEGLDRSPQARALYPPVQ